MYSTGTVKKCGITLYDYLLNLERNWHMFDFTLAKVAVNKLAISLKHTQRHFEG